MKYLILIILLTGCRSIASSNLTKESLIKSNYGIVITSSSHIKEDFNGDVIYPTDAVYTLTDNPNKTYKVYNVFSNNVAYYLPAGEYFLSYLSFPDPNQPMFNYSYPDFNCMDYYMAIMPIFQRDIICSHPSKRYITYTSGDKSMASFTLNAGEIIYIGEIVILHKKMVFVDKYDEIISWFRGKYPKLKNEPVIKRLANVGIANVDLISPLEKDVARVERSS